MDVNKFNEEQVGRFLLYGFLTIACYIILVVTIGFWATFAFIGLGVVRNNTKDLV